MSLKVRLARAAITSVLAAAVWLPAQAAIVVGTFDPPFGPSIPNLGFRGSLTVRVPDACFQLSAGFIPNSDACSGNQMQVLAASVELYNTSTPGLPTLTTLNFAPATMLVNGALTYTDTITDRNQLRSLDTGPSAPLAVNLQDPGPTSDTSDDISFSGELSLQLFATGAQTEGPTYGSFLVACFNPIVTGPSRQCSFQDSSRLANTVFRPRLDENGLPEPASLALVFSALGAAAWTRRRGAAPRPA